MQYLTKGCTEAGPYRYSLTRQWELDRPWAVWIMLNPSTADAEVDDPTIRRCVGFSDHWGFGGLEVVNLFALRATRPIHLKESGDPTGEDNDHYLKQAISRHEMLVAAWGGSGDFAMRYMQANEVKRMAVRAEKRLMCVGQTKGGDPRHPLYVKGDTRLEVYR